MTKDNLSDLFVEAVMTDKETKIFPNFNGLLATCKRWVSINKDVGLLRETKIHYENQFQTLAKIWFNLGQVTWSDMSSVGIPQGESQLPVSRAI